MDVNKDPPLQAVTPLNHRYPAGDGKRNRKWTKTKVSLGNTEVELHRWRRPGRNGLTAGGGGVKQACVYSLEVDSASFCDCSSF